MPIKKSVQYINQRTPAYLKVQYDVLERHEYGMNKIRGSRKRPSKSCVQSQHCQIMIAIMGGVLYCPSVNQIRCCNMPMTMIISLLVRALLGLRPHADWQSCGQTILLYCSRPSRWAKGLKDAIRVL